MKQLKKSISSMLFHRSDLIVKQNNLDQLKKFKKLTKLSISYNHLHSFIVLSKFEWLSNLRVLEIWNNEILNWKYLINFIVYRFHFLVEFNKHRIEEKEKKLAKMGFHLFDKVLSIDSVCLPVASSQIGKRSSIRLKKYGPKEETDHNITDVKSITKKHVECSTKYVNDLISK